MNTEVETITQGVRCAMSGDVMPPMLSSEAAPALIAAVKVLLAAPPPARDQALQVVAFAALQGLSARLRAQIEFERIVTTSPPQ